MNTLDVNQIAKIVHEANRAYCEEIGDFSQQPWDRAEEWQRASARQGVQATLDGSAATPEQQHETWCKAKLDDGWSYGEIKDADNKTHPCLVPYDKLPPEQRRKDHLFRAIVTALTVGV
jgi:hypothetical protein